MNIYRLRVYFRDYNSKAFPIEITELFYKNRDAAEKVGSDWKTAPTYRGHDVEAIYVDEVLGVEQHEKV